MSYLPYVSYKDSGVQWHKQLPKHWNVVSFARLITELSNGTTQEQIDQNENTKPVTRIETISTGEINYEKVGHVTPTKELERYKLHIGDILFSNINSLAMIGNCALYRGEHELYVGMNLLRVRSNDRVIPQWLHYWMKSTFWRQQVEANAKPAINQASIPTSSIKSLKCFLPPLEEQRAIAEMLDEETAKLDELTAEKERLLELLAEKRRALITRAVTRGLNDDVPLRDSGFHWLGEIPTHWEIERAKWLFNERDERTVTGEDELLTVSHITGVTPRSEKDVNMFEAETTEGYKICLRGDLAVNTMWAFMGAMGISPTDGIVSPSYNVYVPNQRLEPDYIDALVRIPYFCEEVRRYSKGVWSSRLRLYPEEFFSIWLPVPPIEEQRAIVDYIKTETKKLDELRDVAKKTIDLLKERRTALIAAAVTGQITVKELQ